MADQDLACDSDALHAAIVAQIQTQFPVFQTVAAYLEETQRKSLTIPACLIEIEEAEGAHDQDAGTGQAPMQLRCAARIIISFKTTDGSSAKKTIRKLALALAAFVYLNNWSQPVDPAEVIGAYPDDFDPLLDQYEVWRVEWTHLAFFGATAWTNDGTLPTEVFTGWAPEIGEGNEDKYQQVVP